MAVANFRVIDGRFAILGVCVADLTVYQLESSNSKSVDSHLCPPGKLRRTYKALVRGGDR